MSTTNLQAFQIKLSFDEGLKKTWNILAHEYEALDKASIVRLALNTLAKQIQRQKPYSEKELFQYFDELNASTKGMSEKEFFEWWNKNKSKHIHEPSLLLLSRIKYR